MDMHYKCPVCLREHKIRTKKRGSGKEYKCERCGVRASGKTARQVIRNLHLAWDWKRFESLREVIMRKALDSIGQKKSYKVEYNAGESSVRKAYILEAWDGRYLRYTLWVTMEKDAFLVGRKEHDVTEALGDILGFCFEWDRYNMEKQEKNVTTDGTDSTDEEKKIK